MFVGALLDPHLDPCPLQKWSGSILLLQLYSTGTNGVNKMAAITASLLFLVEYPVVTHHIAFLRPTWEPLDHQCLLFIHPLPLPTVHAG